MYTDRQHVHVYMCTCTYSRQHVYMYMYMYSRQHDMYVYICDDCREWVNEVGFCLFFLKLPLWLVCYARFSCVQSRQHDIYMCFTATSTTVYTGPITCPLPHTCLVTTSATLFPPPTPTLQHETSSTALAKRRHLRQLWKDSGHGTARPIPLPFTQVHKHWVETYLLFLCENDSVELYSCRIQCVIVLCV